MKKVALVFGGHGFIGSHLVRALMASGDYARVISADIAPQPRLRTEGAEYIHCDVTEPIRDDLAAEVCEIYNLAAIHTTPGHADWEYFRTNVEGALRVCEYARRLAIDTIVFTSSISVYGPCEQETAEDSPEASEDPYGRSKLSAENIHLAWQAEAPERRRLIIARPAAIFGFEEHGNFTRLAGLLKAGRFVYAGRKGTIKSCGYVVDLVESLRYFVSGTLPTITYNFAFAERTTIEDICTAFHRVAGYAQPRLVIPLWPMLLGGAFFELLAKIGLKTSINRARIMKLRRSTNIVPENLDRSGFVRKFSLDSALTHWKAQSRSGDFE
jgi:nucleoside-diphosphate-sugar epimerase